MSYGGMGAVHRLVTKLGLPKQIDERVELLKVHLPYHGSDHVLNLAYDVLGGGNWVYLVIAALAWNRKSWFALMMHSKGDRREYLAMEFRRFLHRMISIPCRVMWRARSTTLRLLGYQPTLDRFFSTSLAIERMGFA